MTNPLLQRPLEPSEVSPFTFASQQDRFLYGYLTSFVREEILALQEHLCRQNKIRHSNDFRARIAEQTSTIDGEVTSLGNGHFLTISGEILHRFSCRKIIVQPRPTKECYSSMPCTLQDKDKLRFVNNTGSNLERGFFIQPRTRILTTHGLELPCAPFFGPAYQSITGDWLQLFPEITYIAEPDSLPNQGEIFYEPTNPEAFDTIKDSIYDQQILAGLTGRQATTRAAQDFTFSIGRSAVENNWTPQSMVDSLAFSPRKIMDGVLSFARLNLIWKILSAWGQFASVFVGLMFLFRFIMWLISLACPQFSTYFRRENSIFSRRGPRSRSRSPRNRGRMIFSRGRATSRGEYQEAPQQEERQNRQNQVCLLYTSPSPRD